jgi:hypothetical protein
MQFGQPHHLGPLHVQPRQGGGQADRFGQPVFGQAAAAVALQVGMDDPGAGRRAFAFIGVKPALRIGRQAEIVVIVLGSCGVQSSPSYRVTGPPGMMVEIACL